MPIPSELTSYQWIWVESDQGLWRVLLRLYRALTMELPCVGALEASHPTRARLCCGAL
jgi:hypothetical protein